MTSTNQELQEVEKAYEAFVEASNKLKTSTGFDMALQIVGTNGFVGSASLFKRAQEAFDCQQDARSGLAKLTEQEMVALGLKYHGKTPI